MIYEQHKIENATIQTYVLSNFRVLDTNRRRATIIICPGGAYSWCSDREAEPIAIKFNSLGYNCIVLYYTTNLNSDPSTPIYPQPQIQLAKTIEYVRSNAAHLNADPNKLIVLGFSAGGHLAASLGVFWKDYGPQAKPNALVLCYPVITSGPYAHRKSIRNLVGDNVELQSKMSLENQVSSDTPPTFIWTTKTDQSVPYQNSVLFSTALTKFSVPNKLVIYPSGTHGLSLGTREVCDGTRAVTSCIQDWPLQADSFLQQVLGPTF